MFRQRYYNTTEDNSLLQRLENLNSNEIKYDNIKFWDINYKAWVDNDNLINYKIQKEIVINNELIFYIYLEDYCAEDWE